MAFSWRASCFHDSPRSKDSNRHCKIAGIAETLKGRSAKTCSTASRRSSKNNQASSRGGTSRTNRFWRRLYIAPAYVPRSLAEVKCHTLVVDLDVLRFSPAHNILFAPL